MGYQEGPDTDVNSTVLYSIQLYNPDGTLSTSLCGIGKVK